MKKIIVLLSAALFLASCTSGGGGNGVPQKPQYEGDLGQKAQEIYAQENVGHFYECDRTWKDRILEMATAIEANRANILEIDKSQVGDDKNMSVVKINGFDFLKDAGEGQGVDQWTQDRYSWALIYTYYSKVKGDLKHKAWSWINSAARSLVLEDVNRIEYQLHPGGRRSSKDVILSSFAKIEKCQNLTTCTSIDFEASEKTWLNEGILHAAILADLPSNDTVANKRAGIKFLYQSVQIIANRFGFTKNSTLKPTGTSLVVPLDLTVFGQDSALIIDDLEKRWSVLGLNMKIENSKDGFRVDVSDTPGERAYVNRGDKKMQLYSPTPFKTIDHEFGHILGLSDNYYTSFDQKTCDYVDDSNAGDIMSSHVSGKVLQSHIDLIKAAYGLQ